jgi:hypothetical protein
MGIMRCKFSKCKRFVDRGHSPGGFWRGRPKLDGAPSRAGILAPNCTSYGASKTCRPTVAIAENTTA